MIDLGLFVILCFATVCLYGVALLLKDRDDR
jgi:hypothetical protein